MGDVWREQGLLHTSEHTHYQEIAFSMCRLDKHVPVFHQASGLLPFGFGSHLSLSSPLVLTSFIPSSSRLPPQSHPTCHSLSSRPVHFILTGIVIPSPQRCLNDFILSRLYLVPLTTCLFPSEFDADFHGALSYVRISGREYCLNSLCGALIACWGARKGCGCQHVSIFEPPPV